MEARKLFEALEAGKLVFGHEDDWKKGDLYHHPDNYFFRILSNRLKGAIYVCEIYKHGKKYSKGIGNVKHYYGAHKVLNKEFQEIDVNKPT